MDLKIKDVAELLKVSETTIRRWLADGRIPAYRIHHQYRFSRMEIESWMMGCKLKEGRPFDALHIYPPDPEKSDSAREEPLSQAGPNQFCLYRALHQGDVFMSIPGQSKEEIIRGTTRLIAPKLNVDAEILAELLIDRENMMPTSFNHGLAVPHTRDALREGALDRVFIVYPQLPIEYGALDGQPVHTLFFLFAGQDKGHLQLLAKLAHLGSQPKMRALLMAKPEKKELLDAIRSWEAHL